jgi:hypothetical protein
MLNNNTISRIYILTNPFLNKWHSRFLYMFTFCIYFCSVKLDFSISYKKSGIKITTINWNIAISCIYEWIKCGCWPSIYDRSSLTTVFMSWRFQPQNKLPEFYFTSSGSPIKFWLYIYITDLVCYVNIGVCWIDQVFVTNCPL